MPRAKDHERGSLDSLEHRSPAQAGGSRSSRLSTLPNALRGNVDTRLRKLEQGEYGAIILASAGLKRLGKTELIKQVIPAEIMCPAAGQGALGIEIREGDSRIRGLLAFLNE